MRLAIFGSGISGLLVAHAALMKSFPFSHIDIHSHGTRSSMYGCQYLHAPIDGLACGDPVEVDYQLVGSPEMYWRKVYEDQRVTSVSPEELGGKHQAWDIRDLYARLWRMWEPRMHKTVVLNPSKDGSDYRNILDRYDILISTIPRVSWCTNQGHNFNVTEIYAMGDAPELGIKTPFRVQDDNSVVCNGSPDVGWYRMSRVFDHNTIEWPARRKPPIQGVKLIKKPLSTDCDCWDGQIVFLGRYGEWTKGVLAHEVYERAANFLEDAVEGLRAKRHAAGLP